MLAKKNYKLIKIMVIMSIITIPALYKYLYAQQDSAKKQASSTAPAQLPAVDTEQNQLSKPVAELEKNTNPQATTQKASNKQSGGGVEDNKTKMASLKANKAKVMNQIEASTSAVATIDNNIDAEINKLNYAKAFLLALELPGETSPAAQEQPEISEDVLELSESYRYIISALNIKADADKFAMQKTQEQNKLQASTVNLKNLENQKIAELNSIETANKSLLAFDNDIAILDKKIKTGNLAEGINAKGLNPEILHMALMAYNKAKAKDIIKNNKLTVIDYSMPSDEKRLWVINMDTKDILFNIRVAHGVNTGKRHSEKFSNIAHSRQTSIGVMKTGGTYHGKNGLSMNLHGLDFTNSNVYSRRVVMHGGKYVTEARAKSRGMIGRSWGCPAVDFKYNNKLIKTIVNGSILFSYYPDDTWMEKSKWLKA